MVGGVEVRSNDMNNLDRLIKAEGVQGGVLAEYEKRFRRFADVRVNSYVEGFVSRLGLRVAS